MRKSKKLPPKPPKNATPAEIKAWVEECRKEHTLDEHAEYDRTGEDIKALMAKLKITK